MVIKNMSCLLFLNWVILFLQMSLEVIHGPLATASEGFNALESSRLAATLFFFSEVSATLWQNS
jgi:hypothetical protein